MRRRKWASSLGLVFLTVLAAAAHGCKKEGAGPRRIRMGAVRAAYYLPFFVVKDQRLLEKLGYTVELTEYERNTDMLNDFTSGRIDVAAQSSLTMFPLEARYPDRFKFIYAQNNASYSFLVPRHSAVHSLRDLAGKTVGTWTSPTAYNSIRLVLRPLMDPEQVRVQGVEISLLNQLLADKKVDAVLSTDVFVASALRLGYGAYLVKSPLRDYVQNPFFSGGGFVSPRLVAQDPQVAADIQLAFDEAVSFINEHNDRARALLPVYLKDVTLEDAQNAPLDDFLHMAQVDKGLAQQIANKLLSEGLLEAPVNVAPLFLDQSQR